MASLFLVRPGAPSSKASRIEEFRGNVNAVGGRTNTVVGGRLQIFVDRPPPVLRHVLGVEFVWVWQGRYERSSWPY